MDPKDHVEIQNPLSEDQRYLKKYPLIPILKNVSLNQKYFDNFKMSDKQDRMLNFTEKS